MSSQNFLDLLKQLKGEESSPEAIPFESMEDAAIAESNPLTSTRSTPLPEAPASVDPTQAGRDLLMRGLKAITPTNSPLMQSRSDVLTPEARALASSQKAPEMTMEQASENALSNYENSPAGQNKKEVARGPALGSNLEQSIPTSPTTASRNPASTSSSSMTKESTKISGTIPNRGQNPSSLSPEDKLQKLMEDLKVEREKEMEDARSREFKASIFKAIGENAGGLAAGMQAMNTGASVKPGEVRQIDIGDLVGQVDKKFAGNREALMNQYKMLMDARDKKDQRNFQQESLNVQREGFKNARDIAAMKATGSGNGEFGKSQMKELGKSSAEYFTKDRDQLFANSSKISEAIKLMDTSIKSGENLSGGISEYIPGSDMLRPMVNKNGEIVKNSMDSAIAETLRPTLGAQFTENEGERIKALQYNPKLPPEENARRARELQKFIDKKLKATDDLYEHLGNGKPLKTFNFKAYGMQTQGGDSNQSQSNDSEGTVERFDKAANKIAIFDAQTKQFLKYKD